MLNFSNPEQWAETQFARWELTEPVVLTDEQIEDRYTQPTAAHAASEIDDDRPVEGSGPVLWLVFGAVLFAALMGVHLWAR